MRLEPPRADQAAILENEVRSLSPLLEVPRAAVSHMTSDSAQLLCLLLLLVNDSALATAYLYC